MPARPMPKLPQLPDELRPRCIWHDCGNLAEPEWKRNKWKYRLYCTRHRRAAAASRKFTGGPWWRRRDESGQWWVKVAPHRWEPQQVAIARQMVGGDLDGARVKLRDDDPSNLARDNIQLISREQRQARARWLWRRLCEERRATGG